MRSKETEKKLEKEVCMGKVKQAINHHMEDLDESELVMVLRYIHKLKDLRIH